MIWIDADERGTAPVQVDLPPGPHVITAVPLDGEPLTREITLFRELPGQGYRRSEERHTLRLVPGRGVAAMLERCGFAVTGLDAYGEQAMLPRRRGFLARKVSGRGPRGPAVDQGEARVAGGGLPPTAEAG